MREIKFRGKRTDNNEWVYGLLINNKLGSYIVTEENPHVCSLYGYMEIDELYKVDVETIGQYTGLKDKNKKEIYSNNKIKAMNRRYDCKDDYEKYFETFEIKYLNGCYMFGNWNAHEFFNNFIFIEVIK